MKVHKILLEDTNTKTDTTTTDIEDIFNNTPSAKEEEKARIIRERRIKAIRVARDAREAAKKARADGNTTMADKLDKEADQLERWANRNELSKGDKTSSKNHSKGDSSKSKDKNNSATDDSENSEDEDTDTSDANRAQDAADAAKDAAEEAKNAAEKAAEKAKEAAESGQADSEDLANAAEAAKEAAEAAEEAAKEAQEHADAAKEAEEAGDSEKAQAEADAAEEAAGKAEEAAEGAKEAAGESNSNNEGDESDNDADSSLDDNSSDDEADEDNEDDSDSDNEQNNNQNSNGSSNSQSSAQEIENPFDLSPRHGNVDSSQSNSNNSQKSLQDEFDNMMQILKMLRNGESAGAKAALNDILKNRQEAATKQESLHEDLVINKTIEEIDDDSFDNIINQVLDDVDTVEPISYDDPRDLRVKKIKQDLESPKSRRDFDREDAINIQGGGDRIKKDREARREARRTNVAYMPGTEQFKDDLYDTIRDQLDKIKKEKNSWGAINKHHQNDNIIKQGKVIRGEYDEKTPLIQVYLDCSASFNSNDIQREKDLLEVIKEFEDEGEIIIDLYYFSDDLFRDYYSARNQGGTRAWPKIIANIIKTAPSNVLIVTDSDMEHDAIASNKYYRVDGCVWYIWKRSRADALPKHLDGATGLKEYSIKWD